MKNRIQGINLDILRLISDFNFLNIFKKSALNSAYTENKLNGEIGNNSVDISVNNNMNFKKI
jgi:hypothetical protein